MSLWGRSSLLLRQNRSRSLQKRLLSSETSIAAVEESTGEAVAPIVRHGSGDGVVTLNVGGKEFITLRSTVQINPVLLRHVTNAEANGEFTKGAVFIDRDPAQFGLILQHLRNRADMIMRFSTKPHRFTKNQVLIQIPRDQTKIRDLFVEAKYFQIYELEKLLCSYDVYTQIANWLGGGNINPFHAVTDMIKNARRALLATSGFGIFMGTQNDDLMDNMKGLWNDVLAVVTGRKLGDQKTLPPPEPSIG